MTARSSIVSATLQHALAKEWIDSADLRLIELLVAQVARANEQGVGNADGNALRLVLAALCRACGEGSLCLSLRPMELIEVLRELVASGTPAETSPESWAETGARNFLADLEAGRLDALCRIVSATAGTPLASAIEKPKPLIAAFGALYFHRFWNAQCVIAAAVRPRPDAASAAQSEEDSRAHDAAIEAVLRETLFDKPLRRSGGGADPEAQAAPLELAQRQKWALVAALRERVFVLSGGPGTGKTTWTASWLRALLRLPGVSPDRVRLCAPTGRAAQRLQESLRASLESVSAGEANGPDADARALPATTLHALLGYQPYTGGFARTPEDPLDADYVLVDEVSMVDVFLLAALVRALRPGTRLVLVGDADQLPPVDAGSALGELLPEDRLPRLPAATRETIARAFPSDAIPAEQPAAATDAGAEVPSVMLDVSHRARGEVVPLIAALLRGDSTATLSALDAPGSLTRLIDPGDDPAAGKQAVTVALNAFADATYLDRRVEGKTFGAWLDAFRVAARDAEYAVLQRLWVFVAAARVLAPLRKGLYSAENANRILRARLEPLWSRRSDSPGKGFHGAPILITRNDRGSGLSNGEIGLWLEASGGPAAFFPRPELPEGWLRLPVSQLPTHEAGFAVTVHKSQGSEYDEVLLILPETGNRLLARETLYTAVTRARSRVRVLGSESAIRAAVETKLRRPGGLSALLASEP
jgi:exodeoxyribonuclease V alpha subunit